MVQISLKEEYQNSHCRAIKQASTMGCPGGASSVEQDLEGAVQANERAYQGKKTDLESKGKSKTCSGGQADERLNKRVVL